MARIIRIEACEECPNSVSRYKTPGLGCMKVRDADGVPSNVGDRTTIPNWCPLPEAEEVSDGTAD